ncbi:neuroligin-3-like [Nilaparvata lugens]|uniref:neuroligin-3-like n=1 Tax=Nilaparvata lugens TaxID=108931 RepID=UPI00193D4EE4|nr:neuroligin-3-like [Nilaparvata lugens]
MIEMITSAGYNLYLFHRAIMSSGSALNPWALAKAVPIKTQQIAASLNCTTQHSYEMVQCLRTKKADDIVAQVTQFLIKYWYTKIVRYALHCPYYSIHDSPVNRSLTGRGEY